jgi:hypothetical protein
MGGADDCGAGAGGAACAGRLGGVAGGRRAAGGAAEPVVSFSAAGSLVMMLTAGIDSDDGKNTFGPGSRGVYPDVPGGSGGKAANEGAAPGKFATGDGAIAGHTVAWRWT